MELAHVLSVVQVIFAALRCEELRDMCSFLGYKSQLENLERTVRTVHAVLRDADAKQDLSERALLFIEELKDAVYDADDLLDEFVTLSEMKKNKKKKVEELGKVSQKVHQIFSSVKGIAVARKMSNGVKEIRKKLDAITKNHNDLGFKLDCEPIRRRRDETCSYVYEPEIIGREEDKEKVAGMLLDSGVKHDFSCLTIVGIGGLGKTTLAQLVYNEARIVEEFPVRFWVCVSNEDRDRLDVKSILERILDMGKDFEMERLKDELREKIRRRKYLLVLDDVWNENREQWVNLVKYFRGSVRGSRIVVTTRSKEVARIIGNGHIYELQGLSEENSLLLLQKTAFEEGEAHLPDDLIEISHQIVKKCAYVPLAIRVVGSLLFGQEESKWFSFNEMGLAKIRQDQNSVSPILKLSYFHLDSSLKSCFSYCALFPKDFKIEKEMLISLWIAQGFVEPLDVGQTIEDTSEEYFSILLRRCFFQDVEKDEFDAVVSCKMHDLMHDIAQEVAGKEICATNLITTNLYTKARHLNLVENEGIQGSFDLSKTRTCFLVKLRTSITADPFLGNLMCLRALTLKHSGFESLPEATCKMLHLRYLDLSHNGFLKALPKSITKLHNLQTLILKWCIRLQQLPKDLVKLVKLRVLDIESCFGLTYLPVGFDKLNCLRTLPLFLVSGGGSNSKQWVIDLLENLKALSNLKGFLKIKIKIPISITYVRESGREGQYLMNKQDLKQIEIKFTQEHDNGNEDSEEALLEDLQPHRLLRKFTLDGFCGARMPSWAKENNLATFLPNLVSICVKNCHRLQCLDSLAKLRHLKFLSLAHIKSLEYVEDINSSTSHAAAAELSFFPSLECLSLEELPKLKVWWKEAGDVSTRSSTIRPPPSFPHLSELSIESCPELTSLPLCPNLEQLKLVSFNEKLQIMLMDIDRHQNGGLVPTSSCPSSSSSNSMSLLDSRNSKLRILSTDNIVGCLKVVTPMEAFQSVTEMTISDDSTIESLTEATEVFRRCSSTLKLLEISNCDNLRNLCGALEYLNGLETLRIRVAPFLTLNNVAQEEGMEDDGKPWRSLQQNLRSLELNYLPQLGNLPQGMQYLTALQSLDINYCKNLQSFPELMRKLTCLQRLDVLYCSANLEERCQKPNGEDWPNIQHIPHFSFNDQ